MSNNSVSCFGYVNFNPVENQGSNTSVNFLISEFNGLKKNIVSHSEAIWYWGDRCLRNKLKYSNHDIQEAYDICYGDGFEYEWELE